MSALGQKRTFAVHQRRAGRHQRKCKHNGRNNGYDCFHASAPRALVDCTVAVSADGLVEHDVYLRRSDRVGPRTNRRNAAPECPLWVKSRHVQCTKPCPLYPRKRTFLGAGEYPLWANSGRDMLVARAGSITKNAAENIRRIFLLNDCLTVGTTKRPSHAAIR